MVAYQGSGAFSGSIVASDVPGGPGAPVVDATGATPAQGGTITLIGGGNNTNSEIVGQNFSGGVVNIWSTTPTINGANLKITDGTATGSYLPPGTPGFAGIDVFNINATTATAGTLNNSVSLISGNSITVEQSIIAPSGNVLINSGGFAQIGFAPGNGVFTAGVGGASAGAKGQNGGDVNITGVGVFVVTVDASGGGGAGGKSERGWRRWWQWRKYYSSCQWKSFDPEHWQIFRSRHTKLFECFWWWRRRRRRGWRRGSGWCWGHRWKRRHHCDNFTARIFVRRRLCHDGRQRWRRRSNRVSQRRRRRRRRRRLWWGRRWRRSRFIFRKSYQ